MPASPDGDGEGKGMRVPEAGDDAEAPPGSSIARLVLTDFRNYRHLGLACGPTPVVLIGPNGAGKTNLLEAVSLLAPGRGMRRAPFPDLTRMDGGAAWAVAATVRTPAGPVDIGTGIAAAPAGAAPATASGSSGGRTGRLVRIDGTTMRGSGALGEHLEIIWLTPDMDGLFTGPAAERRLFLDRLIACFDPHHRKRLGAFERAMRQRNRLLDSSGPDRLFEGLELQMAEIGTAIAAARLEALARLEATIARRREAMPDSPFPWAELALEGMLEAALGEKPALDVEDFYRAALARGRERDRAARRTLEGPHRTDLIVGHGPKAMPARLCSTGEQKALLVGLVLAHAELIDTLGQGGPPILLLDEIAAHLDEARRSALFDDLFRLGTQAWITGTDRAPFAALEGRAQLFTVADGQVSPIP